MHFVVTIANLRRGDKHTPHVSTCPPLVSFDGVQGMNECVTAFEGVNWKTDASSPEIMEFALRDRLLADDDVLGVELVSPTIGLIASTLTLR